MKKVIVAVVITLLLLTIGNFALWFFNTNAITKSLEQLKTTLAKDNLVFEYKEVRYDSFKSWKIEGVIDEPSLKAKVIGTSFGISTPRIEFVSRPFEDRLTISMPGDHLAYQFADKFLNHHSDVRLQFDPGSPPEIKFSFNKSLSELVPLLKESGKNIFTTLKSINLDVKHITILDSKTDMVEQTADNFVFDLQFSAPAAREYAANSIIKFANSKYNQEYVDNNLKETRELIKLMAKQGSSNYTHDLNISFKEDELKNLTELKLDVKEYAAGNDAYKIEAKGHINYKKGEPLIATDFDLYIRNYLTLLELTQEHAKLNKNAYSTLYNNFFTEDKMKILKEILVKFSSTDGKDLLLELRTQNNEYKISGKTFTEVLTMFQPLLVTPPAKDTTKNGQPETKAPLPQAIQVTPKVAQTSQSASNLIPDTLKSVPASLPASKQPIE